MRKYLLLLTTIFTLILTGCSDDSDNGCNEGCGTAGGKAYWADENKTVIWVFMECSKTNVEITLKGNYMDVIGHGDYICRDDFE